MERESTDGLFDDVLEFPDAGVKRRFDRLVGLGSVKNRLTKEAMMRLQPSSRENWSQQHFNGSLPALRYFQRRPPLFILAGDVGTGKTELAETFDDFAEGQRPVLVVMCTNRLSALDPAVMRRAAATFEFTRPNSDQRHMVLRNAFPEYVCTDSDLSRVVELTGERNGAEVGFTFSDITQRLVPSVILEAFPDRTITSDLIVSVASQIKPTPAFSEASLMYFSMSLFKTLQLLGTVPAVDMNEYLKWIE